MKERLAVISTKNPTEILLRTIEGLKKFYGEFDIIIVDSDSTDFSMFDKVPSDCVIEYAKNNNWELGAWTYAFNKYNNYKVYMFIQDTLIPIERSPDIDTVSFNNGTLYSFHYTATLGECGYFEELQQVYRDTNLDFISKLSPDTVITGTAHTSFITDKDSVCLVLQLEDAYRLKGISKTKVHSWLSERTGGILADINKYRRLDITPYFTKIHGGRS
jgi:hypothetical protein